MSDGQKVDAILQQIRPTHTTHSIHTLPKVFNIHNMATNILSRFSHVATHQGIENMNTTLVQHTHNTSTCPINCRYTK